MLHLAWHEQVTELLWQGGGSLWNVDVTDDQDELADTIHRHDDDALRLLLLIAKLLNLSSYLC